MFTPKKKTDSSSDPKWDFSPPHPSGKNDDENTVAQRSVCVRPLNELTASVDHWNAERMLFALNTMSDEDREAVRANLCADAVSMVVFYANPTNNPRGRLRVEQEMIETLELNQYTKKVFMVPVTTVNSFSTYLARFRPRTFCFVGHCDDTHVGFCDDKNRTDPVEIEKFCGLVTKAYGESIATALNTVCLFACKTTKLATSLERIAKLKRMSLNIVYWQTLTEDSASRMFAKAMFRPLLQQDDRSVESIFEEARARLISKGFKLEDPEPLLNDSALHEEFFVKHVTESLKIYRANLSAFFHDGNPDLLYSKSRFPNCKHCNPRVYGVPAFLSTTPEPI